MDRDLLLTYLDVLETRNFNRSADRMNVTQSTVSARIRQLENNLGARLFERGRGGAEPTAAGRHFETHCRSLLAAWSLARREMSAGGTPNGRKLRVSVQFTLSRSILLPWMLRMREMHPKLDLYLEANFSQQIQRDVLSGETDAGIVFAPQLFPDVQVRELGRTDFVLASTHADTLGQMDWNRYVRVAYTSYFERQHDDLLPASSGVITSVGSDDLAIQVLKAQGGSAYLPRLAVNALTQEMPALHVVPDAPVIALPVYSICHVRKKSDPLITSAVAMFRDLLADSSIDKFD
ncbi:LysR family transcriptional regulator [Paracoccus seriniphilus]|uniref:LysR family transcriptional regulator n=1 Tax=Paracoccus seriniphilus TaxID=184748 RepID=UPI003569BD97